MNIDPDFELSADMRLIELQRASLGLAPPTKTSWQSRATQDAGIVPDGGDLTPQARSALVTVMLTATPSSGVIPGAVITATLAVANEGANAAKSLRVSVPVPGGAGYRPGTFVIDGRPATEEQAEQFFHDGVAIGDLAPGSRRTFVWKLGVRLGATPVILSPSVRAVGSGVVGAKTLSVTRKERPAQAFATELERADPALYSPKPLIPVEIPADELPFYELDEEEQIVQEAADAALSSAAPPIVKPEPEPVVVAPEPEPIAAELSLATEAEGRSAEALLEEEPRSARSAVVLYAKFDRATISFFDRTFNGSKAPTILSHCIFASALACSTDADGDDALLLKKHLDAQSQILHRAQLHEKLGKKEPISEYAGQMLAALDNLQPVPVEKVTPPVGALFLETELTEPTLAVLAKINEDRERWDFVKARQLTLALQAQRVAGIDADAPNSAALENALRVYAQTAMTTLQKLFVRLRIDRTTGVLFQTDPQLDSAARALVAAFAGAVA